MANSFQFDPLAGSAPPCQACEALLPDALDGLLTPADQAWFDAHLTTCATCSDMVADAQRGAAWLELLKTPRPEPSPALLNRILAQTSGANHVPHLVTTPSGGLTPATWPAPIPLPANVLPFRPRIFSPVARLLETRLAMTAAMAFFSIAVTLNLTGVHLNQLHAADLKPTNLSNTWFQATAQVHRSYDNLRVVRVLASRVDSVRENLRTTPDSQSTPTPNKPEGTSRRQSPRPPAAPQVHLGEFINTDKQGGLA